MSQYLKFIKFNSGYNLEIWEGTIGFLGAFLDSTQWNTEFFKDWALDEKQYITEGNLCELEKQGQSISIRYIIDDEDSDEHEFVMDKDQFLYLLDKWQELYQKQVKEIIITYDENKIHVEGIDEQYH